MSSGTPVFTWLGPSHVTGVVGPRRHWRVQLRGAVSAPGVLDLASGCRVLAGPYNGDVAGEPMTLVAPTAFQVLVEVV